LVGYVEDVENHFYKIYKIKNDKELESKENISSLSNPNFHEVVSYMPLRKDFDTEYENDYELIFKEMVYKAGEREIKKEIRRSIFESYNNIIKIRNMRKFVLLDRNIMNIRKLQDREKSMTAIERNVLNKMKCLVPYLSKSDFDTFFKGLCIEEEFLSRIKNYKLEENAPRKGDYLKYEKMRMRMLTGDEKQICERLQISYKSYLRIKSIVVNEYVKYDCINLKRMKQLFRTNDERIDILYRYFVEMGWIS
jgi:transcriptional adapter 2-beta